MWLSWSVNHAMPSPKIFVPGFVMVNRVVVRWFTIVEYRLQSSSAKLCRLLSFRKRPFWGCNTERCRRSFFYLVIRSSLLLRFYMPAFLQSAYPLSTDHSEEFSSYRSTFQFESTQQTCLRISENIWKCLEVFERLWSYLKAKETLLCLCCLCYCC